MDHKWKIQLDDNWARLYRWKVGEDRDTHTHRWPFRRCGRLNNRKATNYRRPAEREDKNQAESSTHWSSSRLGWIRGIIHLAPEPYLQERGDPRHTCQFLDNQIHIVSTLVCLNRLEILAWTTARGQRTTHPWIVLVAILRSRFLFFISLFDAFIPFLYILRSRTDFRKTFYYPLHKQSPKKWTLGYRVNLNDSKTTKCYFYLSC